MKSYLQILFGLLLSSPGRACPSCMQLRPSLAEEYEQASSVVVAEPTQASRTRYRVVRVLRGKVKIGSVVLAQAAPDGGPAILSTNQTECSPLWTGRVFSARSPRVLSFVEQLGRLPARGRDGKVRLKFFTAYLNDPEPILADPAYAEMAAVSYHQLRPWSLQIGSGQIRSWLQQSKTPDEYRSLYWTMLSQVGGKKDLPWLQKQVRGVNRSSPPGSTPALLLAYLQLGGSSAVADLEKSFLLGADLPARMVGVQALRYLGTENPKSRALILPVLHRQLGDPRQAGALLRDLALWQDWSCAERVYQDMMDAKTYTYLRFPALRYLLACPEPRIRARLERLRRHPPEWLTGWPEPFSRNLP